MYCINCGKEIKDGSKFCPLCGAPQNAPANVSVVSAPAAAPAVTGKKPPKMAVILVVVLALIGAIFAGVYFTSTPTLDLKKVTTVTFEDDGLGNCQPHVELNWDAVKKTRASRHIRKRFKILFNLSDMLGDSMDEAEVLSSLLYYDVTPRDIVFPGDEVRIHVDIFDGILDQEAVEKSLDIKFTNTDFTVTVP